jgi:hypothetical protein
MEKKFDSGWNRRIQEGGLDVEGRLHGLLGRQIYLDVFSPVGTPEGERVCSPSKMRQQDFKQV